MFFRSIFCFRGNCMENTFFMTVCANGKRVAWVLVWETHFQDWFVPLKTVGMDIRVITCSWLFVLERQYNGDIL